MSIHDHSIPARFLLILAGLVLAVLFVPPFFAGIRNLGNVAGAVIAAILVAAGAGNEPLQSLRRRFARTRKGKVVIGIVTAVIILLAGYLAVGSACLHQAAAREPQPQAVLVVLGCKVRGETPSLMLTERLEIALDYLESHPDTPCIVSGGMGDGENITEAECMYRWLTDHGIAPERILREDASTTTFENLTFTRRILDAEGLGSCVALCTNEFHEFRALRIASSLGLNAGAVPARTAVWLLPTYWLRELCGFGYSLVQYRGVE